MTNATVSAPASTSTESKAKPMFNCCHHKNMVAEINPQLCRLISSQLIQSFEQTDDPSVWAFAMKLQKHADFHGVPSIED